MVGRYILENLCLADIFGWKSCSDEEKVLICRLGNRRFSTKFLLNIARGRRVSQNHRNIADSIAILNCASRIDPARSSKYSRTIGWSRFR
jgi:hypothetical protein